MTDTERIDQPQLLRELASARTRIDVLERRGLESQRRLVGTLAEHLRDGLALLTPAGVHLDVNPAFCEMTGFARNELIGSGLPLPYWPPELRDQYATGWERLFLEKPQPLELVFMRRSGDRFPVRFFPTILRDGMGRASLVVATVSEPVGPPHEGMATASDLARLRRALEGTVKTLSRAIELRDPYTAGHERRVAALAEALAARLGWFGDDATTLRLASQVHDIGKIAVPSEILTRPGRLSETEFALIKSHAQVGHDLLEPVEFGMPIAEIVLQHHERLDGSGYPRGLAADRILPAARVLAVADVVEAMVSHRPYRPALDQETALAEIRSGAGRLYDEDAVAVCCDLIADGGLALLE